MFGLKYQQAKQCYSKSMLHESAVASFNRTLALACHSSFLWMTPKLYEPLWARNSSTIWRTFVVIFTSPSYQSFSKMLALGSVTFVWFLSFLFCFLSVFGRSSGQTRLRRRSYGILNDSVCCKNGLFGDFVWMKRCFKSKASWTPNYCWRKWAIPA
jgi:hypothetical protein